MNCSSTRLAASILVLGFRVSTLLAAGQPADKSPSVADKLTALLKVAAPVPNPWAKVADPFKSDQRQASWPAFVVPKGLRDLFQGEVIVGGEAWCLFRAENGRPRWEWRLSLAIKGTRDREVANAVNKRLLDRATGAGLKVVESSWDAVPWPVSRLADTDRTVMCRDGNTAKEIVAFTPLEPFLHSDDGAMRICWSVQSKVSAPAPTYAELVSALPCMEVRHDGDIPIPESVLRLLRSRQVNTAIIDGTGTGNYRLRLLVAVDPKSEKGTASLKTQLIEQLRSEKFVKQPLPRAKPGEMEFFKWSPSIEASCDVHIKPSDTELSINLDVQLDNRRESR